MNIELNTETDIRSTYLHFRDDGRADSIAITEVFWAEMAEGKFPQLEHGRLMSAFTFSESWPTWERHPAGEELVMLLSGSAIVVFEEDGEQRTVPLNKPGAYVLVPKNIWHTARTAEQTTMLFLTPGAGTEHRMVE